VKPDDSKLEEQVIRLPHRERARIALKLLESLDPGKDEDVSELWLQEAERRLAAYDAGETDAQGAEEVFSEIERQLK
jgi:putative addiction module component (TIGR02574 family)